MKKYPFTNDYFFSLIEKDPTLDFEDLTIAQKREAVEALFRDASKINEEEIVDFFNSGKKELSFSLCKHLFEMNICCNCHHEKTLGFINEIIKFFWINAYILFKEIFAESKSDYLDEYSQSLDYENSPYFY